MKHTKIISITRKLSAYTCSALLFFLMAGSALAAVNPPVVNDTLTPGASMTFTNPVGTPDIPTNPDIVFLADTTGSMGSAIQNVKDNAAEIMAVIRGLQPDALFAAAEYRDMYDTPIFAVNSDLTTATAPTLAAINGWSAGGGGDWAEAQLNALYELATGAVSWRPNSTRIIVWFGDAPGHDPSNGHDMAAVLAALAAQGIRVIAVDVNYLDYDGQATAITAATDGGLYTIGSSSEVSDAILAGLMNLPVTVNPVPVGCSPLVVSFAPASATVISGADAIFNETISVPADPSLAGQNISCTVEFRDEATGELITPDAVQHINIEIPVEIDLLPEEATNELPNDSDHTVTAEVTSDGNVLLSGITVNFEILSGPNAGETGSGTTDAAGTTVFNYAGIQSLAGLGDDTIEACLTAASGDEVCDQAIKHWVDTTPPDATCGRMVYVSTTSPSKWHYGYFRLSAEDALDPDPEIFISGFGPFRSGDRIRISVNPSAVPSMVPGRFFTHLILNAAPVVTAVDANGNTSLTTCPQPQVKAVVRRRMWSRW